VKNAYIPVDDEEILVDGREVDARAIESNHTIEIVPGEQIDQRYVDSRAGEKAFAYEAMRPESIVAFFIPWRGGGRATYGVIDRRWPFRYGNRRAPHPHGGKRFVCPGQSRSRG